MVPYCINLRATFDSVHSSFFFFFLEKIWSKGKILLFGKDKIKMREIVKVFLSSLQSILAELLLSDHQSCSFLKDLAEGRTRQKKILNSSDKEQLKVAGKLKVALSFPYVWLGKELYLIPEH